MLEACGRIAGAAGDTVIDAAERARIRAHYAAWSERGYRVLGVAVKEVDARRRYERADEVGLIFAGFLRFSDPPKRDAAATLESLAALGVQLKIITGDNRHVARHVAQAVGLGDASVISGGELAALKEEALWSLAERTSVFAEVDPAEKERIILALRKAGRVVGYLGDGINDAPALHAADVGVSVDRAVDVAKEAADFVLLQHDLDVLRRGIEQGRLTFANTLKYVAITTSANFGNMLSMAAASLVMPFLPLLAKQILLNNLLSDIPGMTIAGDNVDRELIERPPRWDIRAVKRFMLGFGVISSAFDFLTFGVLLFGFGVGVELFRTGWFVESLLTELVIALVVRTNRPLYRSMPGRWLFASTLIVFVFTLALPFLPGAAYFDFVPLPPALLGALLAITVGYGLCSELAKHAFRGLRWTAAPPR